MIRRPPAAFLEKVRGASALYGKGTRLKLAFFDRDVVVQEVNRDRGAPPENDRSGTELDTLSPDSMRRLIFLANNCRVRWRSLLTVTYPETWPLDQRASKKHLQALLQWLRREYQMESYIWVREAQERGAPHYHILTDVALWPRVPYDYRYYSKSKKSKGEVPRGTYHDHDAVSHKWQECIKNFGSQAGINAGCRWEVIRKKRGGASYLATYFGKEKQKHAGAGWIKCGRWWGNPASMGKLEEDFSVEIGSDVYFRLVEGNLKSDDGWLYTLLHDGRKRAWRLLCDVEGGDRPGVGVTRTKHARE